MSEEKGYCRWCDTQTNTMIREHDEQGRLIWVGCADCYVKKESLKKHAKTEQ